MDFFCSSKKEHKYYSNITCTGNRKQCMTVSPSVTPEVNHGFQCLESGTNLTISIDNNHCFAYLHSDVSLHISFG